MCRDRATAVFEDICFEKIRGCSYRGAASYSKLAGLGGQKSLNANEFLAMVAKCSFYRPEDDPCGKETWGKGEF